MLLRIGFLNGRKDDGSPFHCLGESKVGRKSGSRTITEVSQLVASKNRQKDLWNAKDKICLSYEHKEAISLNTFSDLKKY